MVKISTFNYIFVIAIILVPSQAVSAISKNVEENDDEPCNWQARNVFFICHGYSNELKLNNETIFRTSIATDENLSIEYQSPLWPFYPRFKVWNDSGLINDFKVDFCHFYAKNFNGFILHRISFLGNFWLCIGNCKDFQIVTSYSQ